MAEIIIKIGTSGPEPKYQDGDVVCAFNDLAVDYVHAQHICFPRPLALGKRFVNKTSDGLLPTGGLEHFFCKTIFQMQFERISFLEVKATDLETLEEFVDAPRGWFTEKKLTDWGVSIDGLPQRVNAGTGNVNTDGTTAVTSGSVATLFTLELTVPFTIEIASVLYDIASITDDDNLIAVQTVPAGTNQSYNKGKQEIEYFFDLRPGGTHNDVPDYVEQARKSNGKLIFGTIDNEIWYGGKMTSSTTAVGRVWTEIELKTPLRKINFPDFPLQAGDKKGFLALTVDDFDEVERINLTASDIDNTDPDNPILLKKRKKFVDWKNISGISVDTITKVEDKAQVVDLRGQDKKHLRASIVQTKT